MAKLIRVETDIHKAAFVYFLELGSRRSYPPVAEKFGVSQVSIENWARSFDWQRRVDIAETELRKARPAATGDEAAQLSKFMRDVLKSALNGVVQVIDGKQVLKIKVESVADLERIEKIYKRVVQFDEFMGNHRQRKAARAARIAQQEPSHAV